MALLRAGEGVAQVELHSLHLRDGLHVPDWMHSEPERHRAAAFRSAEARRLFIAGRLLCRRMLGNLLACTPRALSIAVTPSGRPYLPDHPGIDFNLSHTRNRVALAICRGATIGIDIERLDAFSEKEACEIMPMILSEHELHHVHQLEPRHRHDAFLACWVQKEAALKCLGQGFLADPQSVILAPGHTTCRVANPSSEGPLFVRFGRLANGKTGDFHWAIVTSSPISEPIWRHHAELDFLGDSLES